MKFAAFKFSIISIVVFFEISLSSITVTKSGISKTVIAPESSIIWMNISI